MSKVCVTCDWCGAEFRKDSWTVHEHNFCCFDHFRFFASKRMSNMNRGLNPTRMTPETRAKLRNFQLGQGHKRLKEPRKPLTASRKEHLRQIHLDSGNGKSYRKYYGRHEHRVVAEQMLGRPLKPGEIVHHIDEDKRNNSPENLLVFASQKEHAAYHAKMNRFFGITGGDDK